MGEILGPDIQLLKLFFKGALPVLISLIRWQCECRERKNELCEPVQNTV